jgi:S-adenosyl methyltransferase
LEIAMTESATERPSPAGVYDYALGGTENTQADRDLVDNLKTFLPDLLEGAWANRGFLQRAVKRMAAEWGIRQFLDLGAGLPTQRNTHEIVDEVTTDGRVVYVDIDPRVVAQATQLLSGTDRAAVIQADLADVDRVLGHPETRRLIDFSEPVGLLVVAVTHYMVDAQDPWGAVHRYMSHLASGSYLALSAITRDRQEDPMDRMVSEAGQRGMAGQIRSFEEIKRFFTGLEIVAPYEDAAPELTYIGLWGAEDPVAADDDGSRLSYAAVARKP